MRWKNEEGKVVAPYIGFVISWIVVIIGWCLYLFIFMPNGLCLICLVYSN